MWCIKSLDNSEIYARSPPFFCEQFLKVNNFRCNKNCIDSSDYELTWLTLSLVFTFLSSLYHSTFEPIAIPPHTTHSITATLSPLLEVWSFIQVPSTESSLTDTMFQLIKPSQFATHDISLLKCQLLVLTVRIDPASVVELCRSGTATMVLFPVSLVISLSPVEMV